MSLSSSGGWWIRSPRCEHRSCAASTSSGVVDLEGQMLEPDAVVAMIAAVGGTKAEPFVSEAHIDDLLGAPVGRIALFLLQPQGSQEVGVERERTIDVADGEVDVLNSAAGHPSYSRAAASRAFERSRKSSCRTTRPRRIVKS